MNLNGRREGRRGLRRVKETKEGGNKERREGREETIDGSVLSLLLLIPQVTHVLSSLPCLLIENPNEARFISQLEISAYLLGCIGQVA